MFVDIAEKKWENCVRGFMKKLLGIVVLGLLWCNVGFAITQQSAIEDYLSDHKLENIEGIWIDSSSGTVIAVYKSGTSSPTYVSKFISGDADLEWLFLEKGSSKLFYGKTGCYLYYTDGRQTGIYDCNITVEVAKNQFRHTFTIPPGMVNCNGCPQAGQRIFSRVWPEDIDSHNAKFGGETEPTQPSPDDDKVVAAASGSGFFVSKKGHIVTNHHVIDQCKAVKVNYKADEIPARIIAVDKTNDLAILQAKINPSKVYAISKEDVSLLEDIIVAGFPLGKKVSAAIKTHKGSVTALAGYEDNYSNFQTDATINQGNSGGPIINQKGNVVGVAVATWVEEGVQGVHFGVKSSTLNTFAKANSVNFLPQNNRDLSNAELGKLITEATVYLECFMTVAKIKQMIAQAENRKAFYSEHK